MERCNEQIQLLATHCLFFSTTDSGFDHHHSVMCTDCIFGYIAMELIAYTTVMNANRSGLWPCHERYADKQVTPHARHNSDGEEP